MDSEETAQGAETYRAAASRHHLSTQKMYELKTKLRCSCEGCPWAGQGGAGPGLGLQVSVCRPQTPLAPSHRCGEPGCTQLPPLV